ncbi:MAG: sodium/solute symporter [Parvularcula sp.]|nr:sodium/solute symporter [Parvularcula sp.]
MATFGLLNWAIVLVYVIANLGLGWWMSRRVKSSSDYHIGDRSTPWWAIGISIVATYVSGLSFLGAPAWAYGDGMAALIIHVNYPLVVFLIVVFFIPFFYSSGVASIYHYLEQRFGVATRTVMGLLFMVSMTLGAASMITVTGIVLHSVLGIDTVVGIVVMTAIVVLYTMLGGMNAVIWTDVLQGVILTIGVIVVIFCIIDAIPSFGGALTYLEDDGKLDPIVTTLDFGIAPTLWAGVFAMTLYHVTVYGANQFMVQRALAAKTMADAKKSYLVIGFAAFLLYFAFFFVGALLYVFYDGQPFADPNQIILIFVKSLSIPGLMGILVAAIMSATMSSASSALNSLATISVTDFYAKFFVTDAPDRHYLLVCRLLTLVWGMVLIPVSIAFASTTGSILETLTAVGAYLVGAKLAMFAMGFFSKHASERGLLIGMVAGLISLAMVGPTGDLAGPVDAIWQALGLHRPDIAWPWFVIIGGGVNVVVAWIASLLLDGRKSEWHEFSVKGQLLKFERENLPIKEHGWYVVPGKVEPLTWLLPVYFGLTMLLLIGFASLG